MDYNTSFQPKPYNKTTTTTYPGQKWSYLSDFSGLFALANPNGLLVEQTGTVTANIIGSTREDRRFSNPCLHMVSGLPQPQFGHERMTRCNIRVNGTSGQSTTLEDMAITPNTGTLHLEDTRSFDWVSESNAVTSVLNGVPMNRTNIPLLLMEAREIPSTVVQLLHYLGRVRTACLVLSGMRRAMVKAENLRYHVHVRLGKQLKMAERKLRHFRTLKDYLRRHDGGGYEPIPETVLHRWGKELDEKYRYPRARVAEMQNALKEFRLAQRLYDKGRNPVTVKDLADADLWYRFGVTPMVGDVSSLGEGLRRLVASVEDQFGLSAGGSFTYQGKGEKLRFGFGSSPKALLKKYEVGRPSMNKLQTISVPKGNPGANGYVSNTDVAWAATPQLSNCNPIRVQLKYVRGIAYGTVNEDIHLIDNSFQTWVRQGAGLSLTAWQRKSCSFTFDWLVDLSGAIQAATQRGLAVRSQVGLLEGVWLSRQEITETYQQYPTLSGVAMHDRSTDTQWIFDPYVLVDMSPWRLVQRELKYTRERVASYAPPIGRVGYQGPEKLSDVKVGTAAALLISKGYL